MDSKIDQKFDAGLYRVRNIPLVAAGDDIGQIIYRCATQDGFSFEDRDIVVVTHKIVSKAENAIVRLSEIEPGEQAQELAAKTGRDPRLCQVYIDESSEILGVNGRMVITRHKLGFINTVAGVDRSNVAPHALGIVILLPKDPYGSARRIRSCIQALSGKEIAVIIIDSFGKPDRYGAIGTAIGIAGIRHLEERHQQDLFFNPSNPHIALIDELAGAASLLMGESDEGYPVIIVRGVPYTRDENATIAAILENHVIKETP